MPRSKKEYVGKDSVARAREIQKEKIEKQEEVVAKQKQKYDEENAKLKEMKKSLRDMEEKDITKLLRKSGKSYEEIVEFLSGQTVEKKDDGSHLSTDMVEKE